MWIKDKLIDEKVNNICVFIENNKIYAKMHI